MENKFSQHEWLKLFVVLESVQRFNILIYLMNEGPKSIEEISDKLNELHPNKRRPSPDSQAWINGYINPLLTKGLIDYADRPHYKLFEATQKATDVFDILEMEEPNK